MKPFGPLTLAATVVVGLLGAPVAPAQAADDWLSRAFASKDPGAEGTTLLLAASHGMITMAQGQLDKGVDVNVRDHHGYTPLIRAAQDGNAEMVRLLIDRGANLEVREDFGYTALMWAVEKGNVEVVRLLLVKGANPDARFRGVPTAVELAQSRDRPHMTALIQRKAGVYTLPDRAIGTLANDLPPAGTGPGVVIPASMSAPQIVAPQGSPLIPLPAPAPAVPVGPDPYRKLGS